MDTDALFERWRRERAAIEPAPEFADRVMQSLDAPRVDSPGRPRGLRRLIKATAFAAAVVAALFRVAELLSLFATSQIEN
jgi:hypothetical protein